MTTKHRIIILTLTGVAIMIALATMSSQHWLQWVAIILWTIVSVATAAHVGGDK